MQHVDGTIVLEQTSVRAYSGRLDLDLVGALPPGDPDVERHAHATGIFNAEAY